MNNKLREYNDRVYRKIRSIIPSPLKMCFSIAKCFVLLFTRKIVDADKDIVPFNSFCKNSVKHSKIPLLFTKDCFYDLSIVVPIYNTEEYSYECISSIINQETQYKIELIIVDDGSLSIDARIYNADKKNVEYVFVHTMHFGQSKARNIGVSISRGKHIMFVDSDDILFPRSIDYMLNQAYKYCADIVEGNIIRYHSCISKDMIENSTNSFKIEKYSKNKKFVLSSCGYSVAKIYDRSLWYSLRFPEGIIHEDILTKYILRRKANKIVYIGVPVYGYRQHDKSSSHAKPTKNLDSIYALPAVIHLCEQERAPFDNIFYLLCLHHIGLLDYVVLRRMPDDIKKSAFVELRKQLISVNKYNTEYTPLMFKLLKKSIVDNNFKAWQQIAHTIIKYNLLKKWREPL